MKRGRALYGLALLLLLGIGIMSAGDEVQPKYLPSEKEFYLPEADLEWLEPGLNLVIQKVEFDPPNVAVTFRITDNRGKALDRLGVDSIGTVSTSFLLGRIKPGESQFTSYATRVQTSPINGVAATQAATDSGGTYTSLGNGTYKYTFGTKLPANFEVDATHRLGMYATRNLTSYGLTNYVANATLDFMPNGAAVTQTRDVVRTEVCNLCHDPLALHGGSRREVGVCVLCHTPQTTDPDTGNTVDFKVMIHKIHRGEDLPSVQAGKPYQIIGFNQTVADYSEIVWPQDTRNCTTCHQKGTQADNWKTNPTRVACGSCHDDVNFATGANHAGGVQVDDSKCSICHAPDTGLEFDLSVAGVHTMPEFSKQLKGINVKIVEITNTKPGDKPTVSFTVKENDGKTIPLSAFNSFSLRLAGPTSDYTFNASEDARSASATSTGYTYTFKTNGLPTNASGTYAVGAEARRAVTIPGSLLGQSFEAEEGAVNPILYFGVGGSKVEPRRAVVDIKGCDTCHKKLSLHGGTRNENPDYCVMCHNPATVDNPTGSRNAGFNVPPGTVPTSINFRFMIHRIHTGHELTRDFTVYRSRGVFNFNEVGFPGDRRNCAKCHVNNSHQLPLPAGMAGTVAPREFYSPLGPAASACLGCHDSLDAAAHAFLQTAPFGEACAACHHEGAEFAVSKVHAR